MRAAASLKAATLQVTAGEKQIATVEQQQLGHLPERRPNSKANALPPFAKTDEYGPGKARADPFPVQATGTQTTRTAIRAGHDQVCGGKLSLRGREQFAAETAALRPNPKDRRDLEQRHAKSPEATTRRTSRPFPPFAKDASGGAPGSHAYGNA
jgi:hypothetical protein